MARTTSSGANFSARTASFERYSSTPTYAPHIRLVPWNAERPWRTRWLSTTVKDQTKQKVISTPGFSNEMKQGGKQRTNRRPRLKLNPKLRIRARQTLIPNPNRLIPLLQMSRLQMVHHTPIIVIPPHLCQFPRHLIMPQRRIPTERARAVEC